MAELICISNGYSLSLNQFLIASIIFSGPENIGFVALLATFGHVFTELY